MPNHNCCKRAQKVNNYLCASLNLMEGTEVWEVFLAEPRRLLMLHKGLAAGHENPLL